MRLAAVAAAAALLLPSAALAADGGGGKSETEKRLEEVLAEMEAQRLEIDSLKARLAYVEGGAGVEAVVASYLEEEAAKKAAVETDPSDIRVRWKDTLLFETRDGNVSVKIGGRVHYDMVFPDADSDVEAARGEHVATSGARRFRIETGGTLFGNVYFQDNIEFSGTAHAWKDNYVGIRKLPLGLDFRVGYFKEPFSLEQMTSSNWTTFMERSLADVFAPSFNHGAMLSGEAVAGRLWWWAGDFWDGGTGSAPVAHNWTARIAGIPLRDPATSTLVHLGVSLSDRSPKGDTHQYRQRPEAPFLPRLVDTGVVPVDSRRLVALEGAFVRGPFSLQGEWMVADNSWNPAVGPSPDPRYHGYYVQGSWFLTGESREAGYKEGVFGRVRPKTNFDGKDGTGAFEAAVRYSVVDLDDDGVDGGVADDWTLGVTWYVNPNARIMVNYVLANLHHVGDVQVLEVRFQVAF